MEHDADKTISDYINSSKHYRGTDDSLKDEIKCSWCMKLPEEERKPWVSSFLWTRELDRLLEAEVFQQPKNNPSYNFQVIESNWQKFRNGGKVDEGLPCTTLFQALKERTVKEGLQEEDFQRWDIYPTSLKKYVRPNAVIRDEQEYADALRGLGAFFYSFPFFPRKYVREVGALGALDQLYNNLRDSYEDTYRGLIYYSDVMLGEFGIDKNKLPELVEKPDDRIRNLYEYVLGKFASKFRMEAVPIISANLHPSWRVMLENNFRDYARIEYVFKEKCGYNAQQFSYRYWDYVRADLDPEISSKFSEFKSTLRL